MKTKSFTLLSAGALALALAAPLSAKDHGDEFKTMDTSGDGKVSRDEHQTFSRVIGKLADGNGDGYVTAAEWDAAAAKNAVPGEKMDPAETAAQLRMMDIDADGKISTRESDAFAASVFAKADKDSDGSLTKSEYESASKEMKKAKKERSS